MMQYGPIDAPAPIRAPSATRAVGSMVVIWHTHSYSAFRSDGTTAGNPEGAAGSSLRPAPAARSARRAERNSQRVDDGADLGLGDGLAADLGFAAIPPHIFFLSRLGHVIFDGVARIDGPAEFGLVDGEEIGRGAGAGAAHGVHADDARSLRHALNQQNAGKHRVVWKVALELRLVGGHVLDANGKLVAADRDNTIDQQERIAVRNGLQEIGDVDGVARARH